MLKRFVQSKQNNCIFQIFTYIYLISVCLDTTNIAPQYVSIPNIIMLLFIWTFNLLFIHSLICLNRISYLYYTCMTQHYLDHTKCSGDTDTLCIHCVNFVNLTLCCLFNIELSVNYVWFACLNIHVLCYVGWTCGTFFDLMCFYLLLIIVDSVFHRIVRVWYFRS